MKFPSPSSAEAVITISNLSRRFGPREVLRDVSLYVPKGCIFGLLGENGAGKTTLIKHILGLLRAEHGTVRVFGQDPVQDPVGVLGRIGYLAELPDLPGWMRVDELLRYQRAFYPDWDAGYAEEMRIQFGLAASARLQTLSKGQQAKAGLLIAQAHRPALLLLDDPSSGLDPLVRRDILEAVIRTVAEAGRTVFFSSHLLEEIERVADHIAMLHQGQIVLCGPLDEVKAQHRCVNLEFTIAPAAPPAIAGALSVTGSGREWRVMLNGGRRDLGLLASQIGARVVQERVPSLNEIFLARATGRGVSPTQP